MPALTAAMARHLSTSQLFHFRQRALATSDLALRATVNAELAQR